jgi:hypothetical protein
MSSTPNIRSIISEASSYVEIRRDQWQAVAKGEAPDGAIQELFESDEQEGQNMTAILDSNLTALDGLLPSGHKADFFQCCWEDMPGGGKQKTAEAFGPQFDNLPQAIGFAMCMAAVKGIVASADTDDNRIRSMQQAKWVSVSAYKGEQGPVEWVSHVWDSRAK